MGKGREWNGVVGSVAGGLVGEKLDGGGDVSGRKARSVRPNT
jgi:uncharacterized protein YcfJ